MKHEPPIFLFMQNYSYTRLATANHRRPSPMFPERKGWGGEGGGGGGGLFTGKCISNPLDISVFCRKRNASYLYSCCCFSERCEIISHLQ